MATVRNMLMWRRVCAWGAVSVLVFLAPTATLGQSTSLFTFSEKPGPHSVGLAVIEQYDYSRIYRRSIDELGKPFAGERSRPLQTLVWYPAVRTNGKIMTVGGYVSLWETETSFAQPKVSSRIAEWKAAMRASLASSLWAVRDAPPVAARFPVVIYAPGASNPSSENPDLCEYLASHGYVVIATPSFGRRSRAMTIDLAGVEAQALDISFLIGYARTLPYADTSKVAVVGLSWGGLANIVASSRDNRIKALVTLDGSVRYYPGVAERIGDVQPAQMGVPWMAFLQRNWSVEDQARYVRDWKRDGPSMLNGWTSGDLITVHMLGLAHSFFSSIYQRNEDVWWEHTHVHPMWQGDYGREDAIVGYSWMARYTLQFLNAHIKGTAAGVEFLAKSPAENGVPPKIMVVENRKAASPVLSMDNFGAEVGRRGFEHAKAIYAELHSRRAAFALDEVEMNAWAAELISGDHLLEAIAVLELNTELYPASAAAHTNLGDAYAKRGDTPRAMRSYQAALERDPKNARAVRRLRELRP